MTNQKFKLLKFIFALLILFALNAPRLSASPLDVPFYSQRDDTWAKETLGKAIEGETIGDYGCGVTSIAMVVSYYRGETVTPQAMNDALKQTGAFSNALLVWDGDKFRAATSGLIQGVENLHAWSEKWKKKGVEQILRENVEIGRPAIVYVGSKHYVVVTKYDASTQTFLINDPWKNLENGNNISFNQNAKGLPLSAVTQIVMLYRESQVPAEVNAPMREKYIALGGVQGTLGAPKQAAQEFVFPNGQRGLRQRFEYGDLFAVPKGGGWQTIWMSTRLADVYAQQLQQLGLPLRDEYNAVIQGPTPKGRVDFERGSLIDYPGAPQPDIILADHAYRGEYFANANLSGAPALTRIDPEMFFDWGEESPGPGLPRNGWSARWAGNVDIGLPAANFYVSAKGRVRLRVDNDTVIDAWNAPLNGKREAVKVLAPGKHPVVLEYANDSGEAALIFAVATPGISPVFAAEDELGASDSLPERAPALPATALDQFDPNRVVCNNWFVTNQPVSAQQVQTILNAAGSDLASYVDPLNQKMASAIIAETIEANPILRGYRLSPQLLLVKMEVESNTVWGQHKRGLNEHINLKGQDMGTRVEWILFYAWPDDASKIDTTKKGFTNQVSNAVRILASDFQDLAADGAGRNGWQVGKPYPRAIDGKTVTPANAGTAALYIYTPHIYNDKVNIFSVWQRRIGTTACDDSLNGGTEPPISTGATATSLVMDVSGSMASAWRGGVKLESAKRAASNLVSLIEQDSQAGGVNHQVGMILFSDDAAEAFSLSGDFDAAQRAITGLSPQASTNMGAGLALANRQLQPMDAQTQKVVVLLTDGMTNVGMSQDAILQGPIAEAVTAGACLFTIGFGDPGDLDEDFLKQIAAASPCGQYYYAASGAELETIYIRVRHVSAGNVLGEFSSQIAQGQTVHAGDVNVPQNQETLNATVNWPGSRLELDLVDPQGVHVTPNYSGANISSSARLVSIIVKNPQPGAWRINIVGAEVPENVTTFNAIVSSRTGAMPTPGTDVFPLVFIFVAIAGGVGLLLFVLVTQRGAKGELLVVRGSASRQRIALSNARLRLGRDGTCQLRFPSDRQVSKQHAEIRRHAEGFVLYDLNSLNGTYVNGARVSRHFLQDGDEIRIGNSVVRVQNLR